MAQKTFEFQDKDKMIVMRISRELLEAFTDESERRGMKRLSLVRLAFEQFLEKEKDGTLKGFKPRFECFAQGEKLSIRLASGLYAEMKKISEKRDLGLYELMREAMEQVL